MAEGQGRSGTLADLEREMLDGMTKEALYDALVAESTEHAATRAEAAQFREQLTRACAVLRMWMDTLTPPHGIPAAEFKAKYGVHTFADAMDAITDRAEAVLAEVAKGTGGRG
jgi:hypothetical protein